MQLNTVIFDMDGLLIDSEPLWGEAADEIFAQYGLTLTPAQYASTTGLRTREFLEWWFRYFGLPSEALPEAEQAILAAVLSKVKEKGQVMPGVEHIFRFFRAQQFRIGLASSSPIELIDLVVDKLGLRPHIQAYASAEHLPYGKPHPQVYLDCATALNSEPTACICFEDSFNGMIAAKAARMKCVVVPHHEQARRECWGAADLKLSSLQNFSALHLDRLRH